MMACARDGGIAYPVRQVPVPCWPQHHSKKDLDHRSVAGLVALHLVNQGLYRRRVTTEALEEWHDEKTYEPQLRG